MTPCIITTNAHKQLANDIINCIDDATLVSSDIQYFANGEIRPVIKQSIRKQEVFIITTGSNQGGHTVNDYIMEACLTAYACKTSDAKKITLICPCLPYARQEKKDNPRGCISAKLLANMFQNAGISRVVCVDLHTSALQGFFDMPADNMYAKYTLIDTLDAEYTRENIQQNFVAISPDLGAVKNTKDIAQRLGIRYLVISKERLDSQQNMVADAFILGDKSLLKNKTAFIFDDMCDTGGTIAAASNLLVENGAKEVIVAVTHGIFSPPALDRINNTPAITKFFTSDTLPQKENCVKCPKLQVYSLNKLLANVITRLVDGRSLSELFSE